MFLVHQLCRGVPLTMPCSVKIKGDGGSELNRSRGHSSQYLSICRSSPTLSAQIIFGLPFGIFCRGFHLVMIFTTLYSLATAHLKHYDLQNLTMVSHPNSPKYILYNMNIQFILCLIVAIIPCNYPGIY